MNSVEKSAFPCIEHKRRAHFKNVAFPNEKLSGICHSNSGVFVVRFVKHECISGINICCVRVNRIKCSFQIAYFGMYIFQICCKNL